MARQIWVTVFQSLDGVMQAPGGTREDPTGGFTQGGWQMGIEDEVAGEKIGAMFAKPYALLLGRRTYDIFSGYWPYVEAGENGAIAKEFNAAEKYVMTRGSQPLPWHNSHRLGGFDDLANLKATDGPDLRVWGSGMLYHELLSRKLLDRLTILTYPVVLGGGKQTFRDGLEPGLLRLTDHAVGPKGVIVATYELAGAIPDHPDNLPPPNPHEDDRQKRMAQGTW